MDQNLDRIICCRMAKIMQQEIIMNSPRIEGIFPHAIPIWGTLRELLEKGKREGIFQFRSVDYTVLLIMGNLIFPHSNPVHDRLTGGEMMGLEEIMEDTVQFVFRGLGYSFTEGEMKNESDS